MSDLLQQAAEILTPIYDTLPLWGWGLILAGLLICLIAIRIRRRRPLPLPETAPSASVETRKDEAAGEALPEQSEAAMAGPPPPADGSAAEKPPIKPPTPAADDSLEPEPSAPQPPTPAGEALRGKIEEAPSRAGLLQRLKQGLSKTRRTLNAQIDGLFSGRGKLDDDQIEALEEMLIAADIGVQIALELAETIGRNGDGIATAKGLRAALRRELRKRLPDPPDESADYGHTPRVIMVVGVNGVGKTTTIGKLAHRRVQAGQRVLIAAADTFRAAAIEQLEVWSDRAGAELIKHKADSDPAAVAFDGVQAAVARKADLLIIDTAGRLHTKVNLMEELKKIRRAVSKNLPGAPHEVLLVLDATTGQNALSQAKLFHEAIGVTSIALTKLDGTAKGGIVIAVCDALGLPLTYIGVGEQLHDLQSFDPDAFVDALF
ncbi:MAG: signal recognition particle-docking protein FtsY [Desulfobacterales bacterium]|jgi:fused signal recognition particle receptor